ncbi:hypothetical protein SARC_02654 [Sphaeroforma arctica JP610]|uniref:Uncharacterized protein n=1 Tax=Sphaeroforma arctica JP610 TaxID=667725 RepID=A0A0L0G8F9_9EUKA|nr:hypothetical protein SARC_02654 [Sphaeroforma arctica JP610]KNC85161.1 hypothetical protein SARC_02654 [Sphaeroforma arctica JP610]|eukprot:XP_014159063.1 hypothetical protein SARC_02654 [Sphaeroforma arctica JP610]
MPDAIQQDVGDSTPTPPHERTHAHIRTRVDTDAHTAARAQPHRQIPDSSTHTNPVVPNIRLNSTQPRLPNTRTYGTLHQALCGYCRQPDHALPACTKYRLYCGHLPEHTDEALGQKQCVYCDQFGHPWTACPQFYSDSIGYELLMHHLVTDVLMSKAKTVIRDTVPIQEALVCFDFTWVRYLSAAVIGPGVQTSPLTTILYGKAARKGLP